MRWRTTGSGLPDLLDVNVWLSLSLPDHAHHQRARRYWRDEAAPELALNRITSLALLRLLTDVQTFHNAALDAERAFRLVESWSNMPQVTFVAEPSGLDEFFRHWGTQLGICGADWTDAYLAAFAAAAGYRLVTFDGGFGRFPGLSWLHLKP